MKNHWPHKWMALSRQLWSKLITDTYSYSSLASASLLCRVDEWDFIDAALRFAKIELEGGESPSNRGLMFFWNSSSLSSFMADPTEYIRLYATAFAANPCILSKVFTPLKRNVALLNGLFFNFSKIVIIGWLLLRNLIAFFNNMWNLKFKSPRCVFHCSQWTY